MRLAARTMLTSVSRNLRTPSRTHLENLMNSGFSEGRVDPYLFPARGRKREEFLESRLSDDPNVDPYLFPARGRKLEVPVGMVVALNFCR